MGRIEDAQANVHDAIVKLKAAEAKLAEEQKPKPTKIEEFRNKYLNTQVQIPVTIPGHKWGDGIKPGGTIKATIPVTIIAARQADSKHSNVIWCEVRSSFCKNETVVMTEHELGLSI